jgi:hypothetical protein
MELDFMVMPRACGAGTASAAGATRTGAPPHQQLRQAALHVWELAKDLPVCWADALSNVPNRRRPERWAVRGKALQGHVPPRAHLLVIAAVQVAQLADHAGVDEAVGGYEVV